MFDFNDNEEEAKRKAWYNPIGEFIVLFSNLEFETQEWTRLLVGSAAIRDHVIGIWSFRKRTELIINLIDDYDTRVDQRDKWKMLWRKSIKISEIRNVVAHNPPFENSRIEFDEVNLTVSVSQKVTEVVKLTKPLGDPGSGLSLDAIKDSCKELRQLLIELDSEHTGEIIKYEQRL